MHRGLRAVAAGAALIAVLDGAILLARAGDDGGDAEVLGVRFQRTTTTARSSTTAPSVTLQGEDPPTSTSAVPIIGVGPSTTAIPPTTAGARGVPTTTTTPAPRQVVERSDNSATFAYGQPGSTPLTVVSDDPSDPFRFLVYGQDGNQDGTAELRATLANQTQRDMTFPGGLVLKFNIARDGQFWKTVELRFPDVQGLPARGSLEIEAAVPVEPRGRYDVVGEVLVEYK